MTDLDRAILTTALPRHVHSEEVFGK